MPFIDIKTNCEVNNENKETLNKFFDEKIRLFPGKSKEWLMIAINDNIEMHFKGNDDKCAIIEVKVYGDVPSSALDTFTKEAISKLSKVLNIPTDRIYINYLFLENWGYNLYNF